MSHTTSGEWWLTMAKDSSQPPTTQDIMDAISALNTSFSQKFDKFEQTLRQLRTTMTDVVERVASVEDATTSHENRLVNVEKKCTESIKECKKLKDQSRYLNSFQKHI